MAQNNNFPSVRPVLDLFLLSRPEWAFIFSQVALMVALLYQLPPISLIQGSFSLFVFGLGHFSLNGYYDKESDGLNPRELSLRNPLSKSSSLRNQDIFLWIGVIWGSLLPLNLLLLLPTLTERKFILTCVIYSIGIIGSVLYSVPPFRFKARPFLDLGITFIIIGFFIPLYIGLLSSDLFVTQNLIQLGIMLNLLLVMGIHLPTMLIDLEIDKAMADRTTAVYLGHKNAIVLTSIIILLRVVGLIYLNLSLMSDGILVISWVPFLLGFLEVLAVINLLIRKDQESASLLFKTILITSGGGAVIFGILFSPTLISVYGLG
jgi:1,4-dihydroxy-2-naphthoate octaprenyltransferase